MKHDDRKQQAALALSAVFVVLVCGWMALLQVMKPAGLAGQSAIVGNRSTGALYAKVDGRLHPALNLTSARLATGSPALPTWVSASEIDKYPTGPQLGIPGIPGELPVSNDPVSAWAVCDTASAHGGNAAPTVTAIAGRLTGAGRAQPMTENQAVFATHDNASYLIWNGKRARIDPRDRAVTVNLGLDTAAVHPVAISNALFDAMPATEPLIVPTVAEAGRPSRLLPDSVVGRVLQTRDAAGAVSGFYVLLSTGVQKITAFVADLLRSADSYGMTQPQLIAPDTLLHIPEANGLDVDFYPTGQLSFIDTAADPVICVSWTKRDTDRQASVAIFSGRGLPTPQSLDDRIVSLVRDRREPDSIEAQQTLMIPGASNFVVSTGGGLVGDSRESLFWVSPQGVRYGIERDRETLDALAIDPDRAAQAPWPLLRTFAAGPVINRSDALVARDSITQAGSGSHIADTGRPPVAGAER